IWSEASDSKTKCSSGSCEFFLSCWMTSGLIEGTCGGLLYACCHRNTAKTSEHHGPLVTNDIPVPANYGPVVNDPRKLTDILSTTTTFYPGPVALHIGGEPLYYNTTCSKTSNICRTFLHHYGSMYSGAASARQVQVTLGDYVINSAVEPLPAYTFGVRFKFTPQADRFDVAVLRLDRPVQYMAHIAPICLPEKGEDFLGQFGWAAGWGALQAGMLRLRPKTLQAVDVPVIDNRLCERWHKSNGINVIIHDEMMCAGYRGGGKDSCQGDSGGPLMMERTGRWYLIGIVSAGYSCAQRGQPGIYHRVAHTVDWISYIINS
ncbi:brain-specific serine protease 4-like, partial [Nilaparvata lugens]|uniref:brain-specific serine protease 4-like n=1 Tax=Nilaparvata lugens TaxID=108931 RepID=UPI00193DA480